MDRMNARVVARAALARVRRPPFLVDALVRPRARVLALVLTVGAVGGLVGAAYLGVLNLLEHVLWPTHWSSRSHLLVLLGVGAAVGVLTRLLGTPGDVELLVDNI